MWSLGDTGRGDRRREPRLRRGRQPPRPRPALAGRDRLLVRPVRPAPDHAPGPDRAWHGHDGRHGRRRRRRHHDRHGARRHLDRREDLQRRRVRHRHGDPRRPPVGPRPGRQPGHRRRPDVAEQLLGLRLHRLQPRVPAGPAGDPCVGDPAGLRGRQLRPRHVDQRQPGELPGVAGRRGRRQRRMRSTRRRAAGRRPAASRRPRTRRSSPPASPSARPTGSACTRPRPARPWRRPTSRAPSRCSWRPTRGSPPISRRRRSRRRPSTWDRPDPTTPTAPAASTSSRPTTGWSPTRRLPRRRSPAG